jgi:hypothetical protein
MPLFIASARAARLALVASLILPGIALWSAEIPAFPGAEGFGSRTPGGRGGKVIIVGNLNDAGPGSFRAACEASGPRIVVFRVSGLIDLKTPLRVREPFLTIAGQTAPGDGICLRGRALEIATHDVVVRHLRSRPGDILGVETDALSIGGQSRNVVIDHCSASWAIDENLSPSGAIAEVSVSWCIVAESLNQSVHSKGAHGYGSLLRAIGGVSMHHNLWAHNHGRNPRLGDNYGLLPFPTLDIRNNVMYDYQGLSVVGDTLGVNYIGNYLKPGPSTGPHDGRFSPTDATKASFFFQGNVVEGRPEETRQPERLFSRMEVSGRRLIELLSGPLEVAPVRTVSAAEALRLVLEGAGATLPLRDAVDRRIVAQCRSGSGAIIDSQFEVGGWPEYKTARPPLDSDRDGMPDAWERAHGLNPNNAADAAADRDGDGYTNLEEYINSLTIPPPRPARRAKM